MSLSLAPRRKSARGMEYLVYFTALYPFVFAITLLRQLTRGFGRTYVDDRQVSDNVFSETNAALNSVLPWIYMGR
ncbi:MAG: hypothetical protein AAFQ21_12545 [Pseudomonadota bacterium]